MTKKAPILCEPTIEAKAIKADAHDFCSMFDRLSSRCWLHNSNPSVHPEYLAQTEGRKVKE